MPTISRIPISDLARIHDAFRTRTPIVITGLEAGRALGELTELAVARERLGATPVEIRQNYTDANTQSVHRFLKGQQASLRAVARTTTFASYLDLAARDPDTRWIVTEVPTPRALLGGIDLSALGLNELVGGYGPSRERPVAGRAYSLMFLGNRGNASDLHTDWDGRDVLLHQAFGRKRAVLFPARAGAALLPIDIYSTLRLGSMSAAQLRAWVEAFDGYEVVLEPGETLFMPAFCWHHLEYVDTALSFSFRFGGPEDDDVRFLMNHLHRDIAVHNLLAALGDPAVARAHKPGILALRRAYEADYPNARAKYRALQELARAFAREVCPEANTGSVSWLDYSQMLEGVLAHRYVKPRAEWAPVRRSLWKWKEAARSLVRRQAQKIASIA
jgi:hypothetical protein